ncbi:MAG: sigma-70 family RNA polymerase sigma factor [Myxococcales bacterium]|nr:sigma-70 family RNA polymerase sigma factor [Myxococcales bacterium]
MALALTAAELPGASPDITEATSRTGDIDDVTLRACQLGDRRAAGRFIRHYQHMVFAFLSRMVGPGPHVEDLAQEVFLRAYRALPRFERRPNTRVSTWLLTIATRLVRDRRRKRSPVLLPLHEETALPSPNAHPERERQRREIAEAFERAASQLSEEQRLVFVLAEFHGLSMQEIADLVGVPGNTVKTRLHRARQRLRELLGSLRETD